MKSGCNIERRGKTGTFYFRRAVPDDLRALGAPRDLRISLRTNLRSEAIIAARRLNVLVDRFIFKIRSGEMEMNAVTNIARTLLEQFKRSMFEHHMNTFDAARAHEGTISPEEAASAATIAEIEAECLRDELACNSEEMTGFYVPDEINRQNLAAELGTPAWNQLMQAGKQTMVQVSLASARRWRGDYDDTIAYRALNLAHPSDLPAQPVIVLSAQAQRPLSKIYSQCRDHKVAHAEWKHSTVLSKNTSVRLFWEFFGDQRFDLITTDHAAAFDRALRDMPAMTGKSIYAGLTAPEAIELFKEVRAGIDRDLADGRITLEEANERRAAPKCQRMEPHTRNKHINAMASIFTWARKTMQWQPLTDPFAKFRMSRSERRRQPKKRVALQQPRLLEILQSPRFTGRKDDSARSQTVPGDIVVKDGLYWAPLLEAYQGVRLDEGAKLRTLDVFEEDGMWCLRFNFEGDEEGRGETEAGSGKTEASKRRVPMHRDLIRLGLPDYMKKIADEYRDKGTPPDERWLFPELTVSKHHLTRAANLTKRWGNYLKTAGLYRRWEDGHAFRHCFNRTLLLANVPEVLIKELMGHKREGMTEDTYNVESSLRELKAGLEKLDYGLPLEFRNGEWQIAKPKKIS